MLCNIVHSCSCNTILSNLPLGAIEKAVLVFKSSSSFQRPGICNSLFSDMIISLIVFSSSSSQSIISILNGTESYFRVSLAHDSNVPIYINQIIKYLASDREHLYVLDIFYNTIFQLSI